jgi:hypothetical protein
MQQLASIVGQLPDPLAHEGSAERNGFGIALLTYKLDAGRSSWKQTATNVLAIGGGVVVLLAALAGIRDWGRAALARDPVPGQVRDP